MKSNGLKQHKIWLKQTCTSKQVWGDRLTLCWISYSRLSQPSPDENSQCPGMCHWWWLVCRQPVAQSQGMQVWECAESGSAREEATYWIVPSRCPWTFGIHTPINKACALTWRSHSYECSSIKYSDLIGYCVDRKSHRIHQLWILQDIPARQHFNTISMRTSWLAPRSFV